MGLVGSTACLVDLSSNVPLQHVKKKRSVFTPLCNSPLCAGTLYVNVLGFPLLFVDARPVVAARCPRIFPLRRIYASQRSLGPGTPQNPALPPHFVIRHAAILHPYLALSGFPCTVSLPWFGSAWSSRRGGNLNISLRSGDPDYLLCPRCLCTIPHFKKNPKKRVTAGFF